MRADNFDRLFVIWMVFCTVFAGVAFGFIAWVIYALVTWVTTK